MSPNVLPFLAALREHNSLVWMHANKAWYQEAAGEFEKIVAALLKRLAEENPDYLRVSPKELTFRLNRDTRFSKDKSPYTPAFRAHLSPAGRAPVPVGYYLHVEPGNVFVGGGLFAPQFPSATALVRDYILSHGPELETIVQAPDFTRHFILTGEKLKNVPKGYPPDFPQGEYLKHKCWAVESHLADDTLNDPDAFCRCAYSLFSLMRPLNDYLNQALIGFTMPPRPR